MAQELHQQRLENSIPTSPRESHGVDASTTQATHSAPPQLYAAPATVHGNEPPPGCSPRPLIDQNTSLRDQDVCDQVGMANFTCDPAPYLPPGAVVEDGWQRPARSRVAIGGEPPRLHEEYAIISMEPPPHPVNARAILTNVVNFLENQYPVRIFSSFLSPLGLGLLEFGSSVMRQSMLDISPIPFDGISVL